MKSLLINNDDIWWTEIQVEPLLHLLQGGDGKWTVDYMKSKIPMGRLGSLDEISAVSAFYVSKEASFIIPSFFKVFFCRNSQLTAKQQLVSASQSPNRFSFNSS